MLDQYAPDNIKTRINQNLATIELLQLRRSQSLNSKEITLDQDPNELQILIQKELHNFLNYFRPREICLKTYNRNFLNRQLLGLNQILRDTPVNEQPALRRSLSDWIFLCSTLRVKISNNWKVLPRLKTRTLIELTVADAKYAYPNSPKTIQTSLQR